jgi:MFS family permease
MALAMYSRLRVDTKAGTPGGHMGTQLVEGLSFVRHNFVFAALICLALFNAVFGLSYVTLLPIFADVYFEAGSTGFGLLNAAHGTGALAGTLLVAYLAARFRRRGLIILVGAAGMGVGLAIFSQARGLGLALPVLAGVGFTNTFYLTQVSTHLQQAVPDHLRGRVMGLYALCWNLLPLGGLVGAVLAAAVSARFAVLVGGAMVAANAGVLLASRRLRLL